MDFVEGMDWLDDYITNDAIYVLERLIELRDNADYGTIRNIIFDSKDRYESTKRVIQEQEGITFNQLISVRIIVDETVRDILRFLGNTVGFVKIDEFNLMINMIIGEWLRREEYNKQLGKNIDDIIDDKINFANFGEMSYMTLKIRRDLWDKLKKIGKHYGLDKEESIKMVIVMFLDSRYERCRDMLM